MDRITEEDCSKLTVIEITLREEILERCKIIEVRITEVDVETIIEMITENYRDIYRNDNFGRGRSRST